MISKIKPGRSTSCWKIFPQEQLGNSIFFGIIFEMIGMPVFYQIRVFRHNELGSAPWPTNCNLHFTVNDRTAPAVTPG